jgi:hypothetical protein
MRALMMFLATFLLITGCASQPDYRQAQGSGFGYKETKLSDTQYRIHFKARGSDKVKAMDYAMLRAAEVTLNNGYDWFVVTHRETLVDDQRQELSPQIGFSQRYAHVTECGLISCRTRTYPSTQLSTGIFIGGTERSEVESVLSIELGRGTRPANTDSFDAGTLKANLAPKTQ